ncbi:hypothetical protein FO519_002699 [Halicephalobus sp. NKZ332]|nr:hypothetical protein FO519_002699 [Halicephalobus sp. NKZ332]
MIVDINTENQAPVLSCNVEKNEEKSLFLDDERKLKKRVLVENQEVEDLKDENWKRKLKEEGNPKKLKDQGQKESSKEDGNSSILKEEEDQKGSFKKEEDKKGVKKNEPRKRRLKKEEYEDEGPQAKKRNFQEEKYPEDSEAKKKEFQGEKDCEESLKFVVLVEKVNRRWCRQSLRKEKLNFLYPEIPTIVPDSKIFLKRTHMGFKMRDFDEDVLKEKTSIETFLLRNQVRNSKTKDSKKLKKNEEEYDLKKIQDVVDYLALKRSLDYVLLTENNTGLYGGRRDILPSGVLVIFEFYNVQSTSRMRLKSSNRSTPRSSSSSSSSTPIRAFGALKIAKKSNSKKFYQSPWDVNYTAKAVNLLDENELEKNYLPISKTELRKKLEELSKKSDNVRKSGRGHSLILELQNSRGFGSFSKDEIEKRTLGRVTRNKKKELLDQKKEDGSEIVYDFSGCSTDDVLIAKKGVMKLPIQYNTFNRLTTLFQPKRLESVLAHKSGSRSYSCIFCKKTMTSLPALMFHLKYSYPSFDFGFSKSTIKVSFDKDKMKEFAEKIEENPTETLIKNSVNLNVNLTTVEKKEEKPSKIKGCCGLVNEPLLVTTTLTPYPGLKRIEMNYEIIAELSNRNMREILDVEKKEVEFYDLWNRFILKSENRIHSVNQLGPRVLKFASENRKTIRQGNLRLAWMAFLLHLRPQLTEFELMEAATIGTEFEESWVERDQIIRSEENHRSKRSKETSVESF